MEATETPTFLKRLFMNPLAVRELRVACRSWKLVIILSAYLLIQGSIFAIWMYVTYDKGRYEDPTSIGKWLFIVMSIVLVNVVMLVFPAFSSTAIASEHEKKSFDLLLMTPLAPWEIALGKFMAAALQSSIFIVATIPLFAIANLFGGIDPAMFFVVLLVLVLFSIFISFVGVYASSLVKKAIPAVLLTYALAFLIGFVLLLCIIVFAAAPAFLLTIVPVIANLTDPTVGEGVYFVLSLTATCALYCSFLFISTTNRLKPTSHNKSTGVRILWTIAVVLVPAQMFAFFLAARTPHHNSSVGVLVLTAVYLALVLLVPSLTAPAEAPIPSRRVRREIEKQPQGMMKSGGILFFPGSDRGVIHTALISGLGMILLIVGAWTCFGQLDKRVEDRAALIEDYTKVVSAPDQGLFGDPAVLAQATLHAAMTPEAKLREDLGTYQSHEFHGYLALLLVLTVSVLLAGQLTWRLALSGISRSLAGVLAGLLIVVLLVVPFIAQMIGNSTSDLEDQKVSQFSPIAACINAITWGKTSGRAALLEGHLATRMQDSADSYQWRWITYAGAAAIVTAGLLGINLVSRKKILERVKKMSEGEAVPAPVQLTHEQVQQAIAAVTVPLPQAPAQPEPAAQQAPELDQIEEIDDGPKT